MDKKKEAVKELRDLIDFARSTFLRKTAQSYTDALNMAIKALEQEPCEDCVRRQAVLDCAVMAQIKGTNEDGYITRNIILVDEVKTLPSVNPTYTDKEIDKAQAVEQAYIDKMVELSVNDVLDNIRAEIKQLDYNLESVEYDHNDMAMTEEVHMICQEEVLQIIDKYKTGEE